jgi:putative membrane protein
MNEKIRYFIAGIFIGLSELLPGISGATVALMFGVYEKILTFLRKFKEFNLIIPLILGMILSVFAFSSLIISYMKISLMYLILYSYLNDWIWNRI